MNANSCPAGLYCPAGTDHFPTNLYDRCSAGYYCTIHTATQTPCPVGTLRRIPGGASLSDCIDVEAGYYVSTTGQSSPTGLCSPGYYCTGKSSTATQYACSAGTFRLITGGTAQSDCGTCPAGSYCGSGSSTPSLCPVGQYCPSGTGATPSYCPAGTYNPGTGMYRLSDCISCPAGYYCATTGLTSYSGPCTAGYLCSGSAVNALGGLTTGTNNPCPAGGYCPAGTPRVIPCSIGYFMSASGQSTSTSCQSCTAGYYCAGAGSSPTSKCDAGYYCTGGASSSKQFITPAGSYSNTGASGPTVCAQGSYNPSQGQSACLSCPLGFYCSTTGMTTPVICPAGKYCGLNTITPANCPIGTYNPYTGFKYITDCLPCLTGYACPMAGLSSIASLTICSAG